QHPGQDFLDYWDARGVNAGADPVTWQGHAWLVINGSAPTFYLYSDGGGNLSLIDGLQRDFGGDDTALLRIDGDYSLGGYTYDGMLTGVNGVQSELITVGINFDVIIPEMTALSLEQSVDQTNWQPIPGDLANGFAMILRPIETYHYLNVDAITTNIDLAEGFNGFFLNGHPGQEFLDYWDAKGVNAAADPLTWQGHAWLIINGNEPTFYLHVDGGGNHSLID
ncbi:MAG: hypothetical protein GY869_18230, partial [Planctomycetes bacterium]|nr:hypothetical protein [Planctomycetota bacterium]